jgi:hypothetical protein
MAANEPVERLVAAVRAGRFPTAHGWREASAESPWPDHRLVRRWSRAINPGCFPHARCATGACAPPAVAHADAQGKARRRSKARRALRRKSIVQRVRPSHPVVPTPGAHIPLPVTTTTHRCPPHGSTRIHGLSQAGRLATKKPSAQLRVVWPKPPASSGLRRPVQVATSARARRSLRYWRARQAPRLSVPFECCGGLRQAGCFEKASSLHQRAERR